MAVLSVAGVQGADAGGAWWRDEGSLRGRRVLGSGRGGPAAWGQPWLGSPLLVFPVYQGSARVGFISPVQPAHLSKAGKSQNFSRWEGKNVAEWRQPPASCRGSEVHTVGGRPPGGGGASTESPSGVSTSAL